MMIKMKMTKDDNYEGRMWMVETTKELLGMPGTSLEWPNWQMGLSILSHSSISCYLFV